MSTPAKDRPLWICPSCGKPYVNRNQWHSCVVIPWERHFDGRPEARALFDHLRQALESLGPVTITASKTRIEFMVRVRFAGCQVRRDWLRCSFWLKREIASPRFLRVERLGRREFIYDFALREPSDLDDEARGWLREAYEVGAQRSGRATRSEST